MFNDDIAYKLFAIITRYDKYSKKLHLKVVYWMFCNNCLVSTIIEEYFVHKGMIYIFNEIIRSNTNTIPKSIALHLFTL